MKKVLMLIVVLALVSMGAGWTLVTSSLNATGTLNLTQTNSVPSGDVTIQLSNSSSTGTSSFSTTTWSNAGSMYETETATLKTNNTTKVVSKSATVTWGTPPANVSANITATTTTPNTTTNLNFSGYGSGSANLSAWSNGKIQENGTVYIYP